MSLLLLSTSRRPVTRRRGVVRAEGQVCRDDDGIFHPLGLTFFWALYGWKHERSRIHEHLSWMSQYGFDYLRILGECDWTGRDWGPYWPDYDQVLQEFVDCAYDQYGLRVELTIVGGRQYDKHDGHRRFVPTEFTRKVCEALRGREHKVLHYEMANEWSRLDKVSFNDLIEMSQVAVSLVPNLVSLSAPTDSDDEHDTSGYAAMVDATKHGGGSCCTPHLRRSDHDYKWSAVRQGYDLKNFEPFVASNNEGQGPQSSVDTLDDPLQLACYRALGIVCGGAPFVLHCGQGVTGQADPAHGRPENMWEVPNIDTIMRVVRGVDALLPDGVENWKVVNNGRSDHPLPLDPHAGFWEGSAPKTGVNKNYAAVQGHEFVVMLTGCRSVAPTGPVPAGTAIRACHVAAYDPISLEVVVEADLAAGAPWTVPGRSDTMAGYVVRGHYV